jgi:hypothetical protein
MGGVSKLVRAVVAIAVPFVLLFAANAVAGRDGMLVVLLLGLVVGIVVFTAAAVGRLLAWLRLRDTDAVAPTGVDAGPVEVEGTAEPLDGTLNAPRTDGDAASLAYEHVIKEKEYRSGEDGDQQVWDTRKNETGTVPFVVTDGGDGVVVDPEDAELLLSESYEDRTSQRREYVRRLAAGEEVYVAGEAVSATAVDGRTDGRAYVVRRPTTWVPPVLQRLYDRPFVVSDADEDEAERRLLRSSLKWMGVTLFVDLFFVAAAAGIASVLIN